jgi:hypothetical protein
MTHARTHPERHPAARNDAAEGQREPSAIGTDALGYQREIVRRLGLAPESPVRRLFCEIADVIS